MDNIVAKIQHKWDAMAPLKLEIHFVHSYLRLSSMLLLLLLLRTLWPKTIRLLCRWMWCILYLCMRVLSHVNCGIFLNPNHSWCCSDKSDSTKILVQRNHRRWKRDRNKWTISYIQSDLLCFFLYFSIVVSLALSLALLIPLCASFFLAAERHIFVNNIV